MPKTAGWLALKLPPQLKAALEEESRRTEESMSTIVREALRARLAHYFTHAPETPNPVPNAPVQGYDGEPEGRSE